MKEKSNASALTTILTVSASGASDERITSQRRTHLGRATSESRPSNGCVWPQKRRQSLVLKNYGVQNTGNPKVGRETHAAPER